MLNIACIFALPHEHIHIPYRTAPPRTAPHRIALGILCFACLSSFFCLRITHQRQILTVNIFVACLKGWVVVVVVSRMAALKTVYTLKVCFSGRCAYVCVRCVRVTIKCASFFPSNREPMYEKAIVKLFQRKTHFHRNKQHGEWMIIYSQFFLLFLRFAF